MTCVEETRDVSKLLPEEIDGMHKFIAMKGEKALEYIKKAHKGEIRNVEDIAVVHYYSNRSLVVLWITEYPDKKTAENETLRMVKSMKKFGGLWAEVERAKLNGINVFYVPVKEHYFFSKGRYAFYLIPHNVSGSELEHFVEELCKNI
ncbi:MAG: hypothetical protein DRO98_08660 [Archaeoglobales archaeon]|nr:MAG: hypothetical protein DRO98_08660 [Archaeoglobales archaeon]